MEGFCCIIPSNTLRWIYIFKKLFTLLTNVLLIMATILLKILENMPMVFYCFKPNRMYFIVLMVRYSEVVKVTLFLYKFFHIFTWKWTNLPCSVCLPSYSHLSSAHQNSFKQIYQKWHSLTLTALVMLNLSYISGRLNLTCVRFLYNSNKLLRIYELNEDKIK